MKNFITCTLGGEICRACSTHWEKMNAYWISVGEIERNTPLGRFRHRLEYNIKIDLIEIGLDAMGWTGVV
jgi:hypothetical protein